MPHPIAAAMTLISIGASGVVTERTEPLPHPSSSPAPISFAPSDRQTRRLVKETWTCGGGQDLTITHTETGQSRYIPAHIRKDMN